MTGKSPARTFSRLTPPLKRAPFYGASFFERLVGPFRHDGLAALQHRHQRGDVLRASGASSHVVGAKRQRKKVLAPKGPKGFARSCIRLDGGTKVVGNSGFGRAANRGVR